MNGSELKIHRELNALSANWCAVQLGVSWRAWVAQEANDAPVPERYERWMTALVNRSDDHMGVINQRKQGDVVVIYEEKNDLWTDYPETAKGMPVEWHRIIVGRLMELTWLRDKVELKVVCKRAVAPLPTITATADERDERQKEIQRRAMRTWGPR